jgi:DNA-binding transcriptional ArsR family regulator
MGEPKPAQRTATEAEAKALASSIRLRILRLCLDRPMTNKQLAERLDANPATVLHHVRTLVETGFLAPLPVRRGSRGSRERPYLATRKSWGLDTRAAGVGGEGSAMVEAFLAEVRLVDLDKTGLVRLGLRLHEEEFADLRRRLLSVISEFADRPMRPDGHPYSVFLACYEDLSRDAPAADGGAERS